MDIEIPIKTACQIAELALSIKFAPKNLEIDDVLAPPIAPADIICINVINGKTKARLANDTFPNFDTKYASKITINTIEIPVTEFGKESLQIIFRTGPLRIKSRLFFINKNS